MSSSFARWEKDPLFSAAEEVQDSADRMESLYRNWLQERKNQSRTTGDEEDAKSQLRRELRTALGTAKWQLEEFDRASRWRNDDTVENDDSRIRHTRFISAIGNQILTVENSLKESEVEKGLMWVRLDEGECDELAAFLSGPSFVNGCSNLLRTDGDNVVDCLRKPPERVELRSWESKEEKVYAHRRSASAGNEIGQWAISVLNADSLKSPFNDQTHTPLHKVLSLSELAGNMEAMPKMKWPKNGFCKWRVLDRQHDSESIPLHNHQVSEGLSLCYEKGESCGCCCNDESYDKQFHGWVGAFWRQLQRSQYYIQYGRPVQMILSVVAALLFIVLFILRAI